MYISILLNFVSNTISLEFRIEQKKNKIEYDAFILHLVYLKYYSSMCSAKEMKKL